MMELDTEVAFFARKLLDRAIADLAAAEYSRLSTEEALDTNEQREHVDRALRSLKEHHQRRRPDYGDEWVAIFYLTWYQPRQIQLAYAALRELISKRKPPKYIIDYGCGAWAIQIALALRIADVSVKGSELREVTVHGIDPYQPMARIGGMLWKEFGRIVSEERPENPVLEPLHDALARMGDSCTCHASYASYDAYAESLRVQKSSAFGDCWLTAMHVVDQSNQQHLHSVFERIRRERAPAIELLTTDDSKKEQIEFFGGVVHDVQQRVWPYEKLQRTTAWRQELRRRLGVRGNDGLTDRYLDKSVTWDTTSKLTNNKDIVMIRTGEQR